MLERILIYLLIPALVIFTLPQAGWRSDPGHESNFTPSLGRLILDALLLGTVSEENELIVLTRTAPDEVAPGEVFTVTEELRAKVELEFAAIVSELPEGFELVSGELRGFRMGLSAGDVLTNRYEVRAPAEEGTFTLLANARAKPVGAESQGLSVELGLTVTEAQPPPPPPPPNELPVAVFFFTPESPKVEETVTFNATASLDPDGTITNYRWNLGDGTVLEGPDKAVITYAYESAGTFQVVLIVVDDQGAESAPFVLTITVEELPPPTILGIPLETAIIIGAVIGGVIVAFLLFRLIRALTAPADPGISKAVGLEVERFLQEGDLPLVEVSEIKLVERVDALSRARWVRALVERSLIIIAVEADRLIVKAYGDLSKEERARLDLGPLGVDSLIEFISPLVEPSDSIVSLTWVNAAGETFESLVVVDAEGVVKFDTLMSLVSLALAPEL
jgi:PKD repeat protein